MDFILVNLKEKQGVYSLIKVLKVLFFKYGSFQNG